MGRSLSRVGGKSAKTESNFNVLFLGLSKSGKSSLLSMLEFGSTPEEYHPTEGFNLVKYRDNDYSKSSSLLIWDLGGSQLQRKGWHYFYKSADGIVYIIDSDDKSKIDENQREIELLFNNSNLQGIPIVILANKQDLPGAVSEIDLKTILELDKFNRRLWRIFGTSLSSSSSVVSSLQVLINGMEGKNKGPK